MFTTVSMIIIFFIFNKIKNDNNKKKIVKNSNKVRMYSYCDNYIKMNKKILIEKSIKKQLNNLNYKNVWLNKVNKLNNEFYKNIFKKKYTLCINEINKKQNYCYWVYDNNIQKLKSSKIVILDLSSIYDYTKEEFLNVNYLTNLSKFCHINTIIFVVITEIHPDKIIQYNFKYLNKNNITTPYNYKVKTFGSIIRLKENELSEKPAEISINKILIDIFNRYGGNYTNTTYIGKTSIPKLNSIII